jgi:hypothetical protein
MEDRPDREIEYLFPFRGIRGALAEKIMAGRFEGEKETLPPVVDEIGQIRKPESLRLKGVFHPAKDADGLKKRINDGDDLAIALPLPPFDFRHCRPLPAGSFYPGDPSKARLKSGAGLSFGLLLAAKKIKWNE